MARGVPALKALLLWGAFGTYAGIWIWFFVEIWNASNGSAPHLNAQAIYAVSVLGGTLGTFFSVALGIERKDSRTDVTELRPGATLLQVEPGTKTVGTALATAAVWGYALIGTFALVTVLVHPGESPAQVKALASAFGAVVVALFAAAFAPGQEPVTTTARVDVH
jgi:hypothetical protein